MFRVFEQFFDENKDRFWNSASFTSATTGEKYYWRKVETQNTNRQQLPEYLGCFELSKIYLNDEISIIYF